VRTRFASARRLRWRLTAWVAGVLLVSAAAMFVVVYRDTSAQLRGQIDRDVAGDTGQLQQLLLALDGDSPREIASAVGNYVHAQPFKATSTLLFAIVPGAGTVSNHPELFGAPEPEPGESAAEQAHENALGRQLAIARIGYTTRRIPDVGEIRIRERTVTVGSLRVVVGAGEPLAIVDGAERGIARAFLLAGALILAIALLASYLAGARVSAPLRRMAAIAARVDAGDLEPRMPTSESRRVGFIDGQASRATKEFRL